MSEEGRRSKVEGRRKRDSAIAQLPSPPPPPFDLRPSTGSAELTAEAFDLPSTSLRPSVIQWAPCQRRLFDDDARVIVVNWHRQRGKDFCAAGKAVAHALETGQPWFIVSLTQRQADATFDKAKAFSDMLARAAKRKGEITLTDREYVEFDREISQAFRCTARTLRLPGGGSVTALPGRDPDTLAGLTGNVIFTEFGLFPNGGYDHWRVVFPLSTRGYQVIVISTPRGKNSKFFELFSQPDVYSVHLQTILDSVAEGFVLRDNQGEPTTLEVFQRLYGDPAGWRREYLCEFTGDMEALVKWAQLVAAGSRESDLPFECLRITDGNGWREDFFDGLAGVTGRPELGWDVARRSDLSSLWVNVAGPGGIRRLRWLVLMARTEFALQRTVIRTAMQANRRAVGCGDATGLGMDSNETLTTLFGSRWQGVDFTAKSKRELGSLLATAYDEGSQLLPPSDGEHKYIHTDLYAIQREGAADQLRLAESDNPLLADSHCDIAYSNALSLKAAGIVAARPYVSLWRQTA